MKKYQLLVLRRFNDGNAYPRTLEKGWTVVVDERQKSIMLQSDPEGFEVLGLVVPKPKRAPSKKGAAK